MAPKLTIGMATYDDADGVFFSLLALRLYHLGVGHAAWNVPAELRAQFFLDPQEVELLVVDNHPVGKHAEMVRQVCTSMQARYLAMPEPVGTSAPRDRVFEEAAGEVVLCMDSHVQLPLGALVMLQAWFDAHPDCLDLIHGPLLYDTLQQISTHFIDAWPAGSEMWGQWGSAWEAPDGQRFSVIDDQGQAQAIRLEMAPTSLTEVPRLEYAGHEAALAATGYRPLGVDPGDEFDVPGQGLGLFACRKSGWLGFHKQARGFGGEEMCLHEKYRQAGRRVRCLGFLKWAHRFGRVQGVPYPLTRWNKVRNYLLWHRELGIPLDRCRAHFVDSGLMPAAQFDALAENPAEARPPADTVWTGTLPSVRDIYNSVVHIRRDLDQHMPYLAELAHLCPRITEFSKRRESLIAFAHGGNGAGTIRSYNAEANNVLAQQIAAIKSSVHLQSQTSDQISEIPETDLLFLDSQHTAARLSDELRKFAPSVQRFIVMHDTQLHGMTGEDGGPGLFVAIREFLAANAQWFVAFHTQLQYGLTVLGRLEEDRPAEPILPWPPGFGPGTELTELLSTLGITPGAACDCKSKAQQMDRWGVDGCRQRHDIIVGWMREGQGRWGWKEKLAAAAKAVSSGLAFKLNPLDPFPALVDEAIRRAAAKQPSAPPMS